MDNEVTDRSGTNSWVRLARVIPAIVFFAFICWNIYLANHSQRSLFFRFSDSLPYGDKISHGCLYGALTLLANLALNDRFLKWPWLLVGSLAVLTFSLGEELTQYFIPSRTLDWFDALADVVGIGIATLISIARRSA